MKKILLANGDSWTYGSEIMAPEFLAHPKEKGYGMGNRYKKDRHDTDPENDYYRIPRIWPTILADMLGVQCVNISWPARSNDSIYDTTMAWLLKHYVVPRKPTADLLVVIGWSSPERKNILIEDGTHVFQQTIWPAMADTSYYANDLIRDYFKFHVMHLWSEYEYISRFIEQNHQLKNFCELHGIDYVFFNAFYETPNAVPSQWKGINISETINNWDHSRISGWVDPVANWEFKIESLKNQWASISEDRFVLKDLGSFKGYIDTVVNKDDRMINWHPSPISHAEWAKYLHKYIVEKRDRKSSNFLKLMKNGDT